MASRNHLDLLRQGTKVWNKWRERRPASVPDLTGANLVGVNLVTADLSGANLSNANLIEAKLIGSSMVEAVCFAP